MTFATGAVFVLDDRLLAVFRTAIPGLDQPGLTGYKAHVPKNRMVIQMLATPAGLGLIGTFVPSIMKAWLSKLCHFAEAVLEAPVRLPWRSFIQVQRPKSTVFFVGRGGKAVDIGGSLKTLK